MNRWDHVGIIFIMISVGFCAMGILRIQTNTEDVLQWLPDQSNARTDFDFFESSFGSDDFLVITWDGCSISDPRLTSFAARLRESDPAHLIASVTTGKDVVDKLGADAKGLQELKGLFFGLDDPELTCAFIELSKAGSADRGKTMELVWQAIEAEEGLDRRRTAIGGYPYIATYIDRQLKNSFRYFLLPSVILATLISLVCLRNLRLALIVFVTATGAAACSIAFIPICQTKFGGLMPIIPALVFVLATSGSIHLIRYGLDHIGQPMRLLSIGWKPCTISTLTTAIGMLSLARSDFPAIRNFGIYCAAGVGFALIFQLIMVPWLLCRFGKSGLSALAVRQQSSHFWNDFATLVQQRKIGLAAISVALMLVGAVGLLRLKPEVEVEKLFRPEAEILTALSALELRFGPMDQTELLLVFDQAESDEFPGRVELVRKIQAAVTCLPQVAVAHSLINFLPEEPSISNARSFFKRSTYRSALKKERANFADGSLLSTEGAEETWRISLRFPFTADSDFGAVASEVIRVSKRAAEEHRPPDSAIDSPKFVYTGNAYLFHQAQVTLLRDLFSNFLLAFVIITPILMIVLRSFRLGAIAMLPNLFPTLIVFGGLGWCDHPVDLAIAMTACVALGIAVDDTTHFLVRFSDFGGSLSNVVGPVRLAIGQCGPAMLHTTLIASAGLMVYYFSEMLVVSRFAWAISLLLAIALLADVIMLPAILFICARKDVAGVSLETTPK